MRVGMGQFLCSSSLCTRALRVLSRVVLVAAALALAAGAAAGTTDTMRVPFMFDGTNPCTGEFFSGNGFLHLEMSGNASGGGMVLSHLEANLESLQAVTLTGAKYVIPDSFSQTIVFDSTDLAPFIETFEFDTLFVRVGEDGTFIMGDDFHVHFLAHATVDGNGVVTVSDFTVTTRCQ